MKHAGLAVDYVECMIRLSYNIIIRGTRALNTVVALLIIGCHCTYSYADAIVALTRATSLSLPLQREGS